MKALLALAATVGLGTVGYQSLTPSGTSTTTVDPAPAIPRPPLPEVVAEALQPQPILQALPPPTGLNRYDPAWNIHAADVNLTCQVLHNGNLVQSATFTKSKNIVSLPGVDGSGNPIMIDYWAIGAGYEYWTGTVSGRTVRLVHPTGQVPGSSLPTTFYVTPLSSPAPWLSNSGYYCLQTSLNPPAAVCDVSYEWASVFGGGRVVFAFGP